MPISAAFMSFQTRNTYGPPVPARRNEGNPTLNRFEFAAGGSSPEDVRLIDALPVCLEKRPKSRGAGLHVKPHGLWNCTNILRSGGKSQNSMENLRSRISFPTDGVNRSELDEIFWSCIPKPEKSPSLVTVRRANWRILASMRSRRGMSRTRQHLPPPDLHGTSNWHLHRVTFTTRRNLSVRAFGGRLYPRNEHRENEKTKAISEALSRKIQSI